MFMGGGGGHIGLEGKKMSGVQNGPFILCWSCQRVILNFNKPKSIWLIIKLMVVLELQVQSD